MNQPIVYAIFPTPIYVIDCDDDIQESVDFLNKDHELIPNRHAMEYGNKTVDDYILDNPECAKLKSFITTHLEKYASDLLAWEFEKFQITQSWVTMKKPGETHSKHFHPNSILSAVFYFQDVDINSFSPLVFHRPDAVYQLMHQFAPWENEEKKQHTEFPWNEWKCEPRKNRLIIFPSWLHHSVNPNRSDLVRKSLAVNAVPTGKFGCRMHSTELDINKLK